MNLLLTSNGLKGKVKEIFPSLLKKNPSEITVAFDTTAAYGEEDNPIRIYKYSNELQDQGIRNIETFDLRNKTQGEVEQILATKDIVYVNGGNTFFLLDWVRRSGFDKSVKKFVRQEKLYIGVSAGSILCCPTIETARWDNADPNNVGITDITALNFTPFLIWPHFEERQREMVTKEAHNANYPVIALTDTQAVLVRDKKIEIIGEEEKLAFNIVYDEV